MAVETVSDEMNECDCIERRNRGLASLNIRVECATSEHGTMIPIVWTVPVDPSKVVAGEATPVIAANFCPFCGRKMLEVACRRN